MTMKQSGRMSGRLIYVATVVAILGVTGGVAMGSLLTAQSLNQTASMYQGNSSNPVGYGTPALAIGYVPASVTTCSSGTVTEGSNNGVTNVYFGPTTGATTCSTNDFAEVFTISYSATITGVQTDKFTVSTQYGTGPTTAINSVSIATGASGSPWAQTVNIYVDYGSGSAPTGGISTLSLVIQ